MPFELRDFHDLLQLLRDHPEWREELRAILLTQELLTLPALVRELTATVASLAEGQQQLSEQQRQLTARMDQLTLHVDQLTATVARLADDQQHLSEQQQQLTATVARLSAGQQRLDVQMGQMRGWFLEQRYRTYAAAYFGRFLRRVQLVNMGRLADALKERLEEGEVAEVLLADLILTGLLSQPTGPLAIWVVLEVSATTDRSDVERARQRARLLRRAGYPAVAVAAGMDVTEGAQQAAREVKVALLLDGRIDGWQDAIDDMLTEREESSR